MRTHGYLIFKDGRGYYRPGAGGYTLHAGEAGRFSLNDAIAYSHPNGQDGPRDGITYKHESEVAPDGNCEADLRIYDLTNERDNLRLAQETLYAELDAARAMIETMEAEKRGTEKAMDFMAGLLN